MYILPRQAVLQWLAELYSCKDSSQLATRNTSHLPRQYLFPSLIMHLMLTGATGIVGSSVLAHILPLPAGAVARLSILSRNPVTMAEPANKPNIEFIQHNDFSSYPPE